MCPRAHLIQIQSLLLAMLAHGAMGLRADILSKPEALGSLMQREQQAVLELLLAVILQQVQLVEAGVGAGQAL